MKNIRRNGIIAGGNWIVDYVKMIDVYPGEEALANINAVGISNGGAPYSVLKAISKLEMDIPLAGIGRVGDDESGQYILDDCAVLGIDTAQLRSIPGDNTSYTDVMTVAGTGKRTFFHFRGANSSLTISDFDFQSTRAAIFHLGYLLLLDQLDTVNSHGISEAAQVLASAREAGMLTSVDIVSEQSDRYGTIIPSALPFIDILFINEFEAQRLTGEPLSLAENGPDPHCLRNIADKIIEMGAAGWVIIHFPQGVIALHKDQTFFSQPGIRMPSNLIKGTVGAGDAFAAGVLAGFHENYPVDQALELGVCVAAASLTDSSASLGIKRLSDCLSFRDNYGFSDWIKRSTCFQ